MGLDTTHGCWSGSYGRFDLFRRLICEAIGGKWATHDDPNFYYDPDTTGPGIVHLLHMNDCEGTIPTSLCLPLAEELEAIADRAAKIEASWTYRRDGCLAERMVEFAAGCREAAAAGEDVEFF